MPLEMNYKSYGLYVFVLSPDAADAWKPGDNAAAWLEAPEFGGSGAIFGGKGKECQNCVERDPYNVLVDISEVLARTGLSRHDAVLRVMCVDEEGEISRLEDTPVPVPYLNGPFFDNLERTQPKQDGIQTGSTGGDIKAMQLWLKKYEWYDGEVDGFYGPDTEAAVLAFQEFSGMLLQYQITLASSRY